MNRSYGNGRIRNTSRDFGVRQYRARIGRKNTTNGLFFVASLLFAGAFIFIGFSTNFLFAFIFLFLALSTFFIFVKNQVLLFLIFLVFMFPVPISIGIIHITPMDIMLLMMMLSVLYQGAVSKGFEYPPGVYLTAGALFVLSVILSTLAAANIFTAFPEIIQFTYFTLIIPFVVMNIAKDSRQILSVLKFLSALLVLQSVLVIVQFYMILNGNTAIREAFRYANRGGESGQFLRSYGSVGPAVGIFFAVGVCIMLVILFRNRSTIMEKTASFTGVMMLLYANSCSGLRSGLGIIAVIIPSLALMKRRYMLSLALIMVIAVAILGGMTVGREIYPFKLYYEHGGFRETDIADAMSQFKQKPLLGFGPQQFIRERIGTHPTGAENEMVRRLVEGGIVGGAVFVFWCAAPLFMAGRAALFARSSDVRNAGLILLAAFLVFVINGFAVADLFEGGHGHLMLVILGFILVVDKEYKMSRSDAKSRVSGEPHDGTRAESAAVPRSAQ
jgi:O-antigen ligase